MRTGSVSLPLLLSLSCVSAGCDSRPRTQDPPEFRASRPVAGERASGRADTVEIGRAIFLDEQLSLNRNQSCAACHAPEFGFTGPDTALNARGAVYRGSIPTRFGNRKPPSSAYATLSPVLERRTRRGETAWSGGNFWDGRATGRKLGSAAADQAQGPFLNPVEQALPDAACVVYRVSRASYSDRYVEAFGNDIRNIRFPANTDELCSTENTTVPLSPQDRRAVEEEFGRIAIAIATFEGSPLMSPFSSRFDAWRAGTAKLTDEEALGFALFQGKAKCVDCHTIEGERAAFTDFSFENVGVPANPDNPVYAHQPDFVDVGLGSTVKDTAQDGKHKVATLRNVDRRPSPDAQKAYMHNGFFKNLETVVHFYNTRDVLPQCERVALPEAGVNCWPKPEVARNVNRTSTGNLGLTPAEEAALVAFLRTLSDGYERQR